MSASRRCGSRRAKRYAGTTGGRELCIVVVSGRVTVASGDLAWRGARRAREPVRGCRAARGVSSARDATCASPRETDAEIALCTAPARKGVAPRRIEPAAMRRTRARAGHEHALRARHPAAGRARRGAARRRGDHAAGPFVELSAAQARHRRVPAESSLEETYYHRLDPPQGFAFQRVYTDDRSLDEAMTVEDRDVVMVPRGYHPVIVPHGYTSYYLNVMAGPQPRLAFPQRSRARVDARAREVNGPHAHCVRCPPGAHSALRTAVRALRS